MQGGGGGFFNSLSFFLESRRDQKNCPFAALEAEIEIQSLRIREKILPRKKRKNRVLVVLDSEFFFKKKVNWERMLFGAALSRGGGGRGEEPQVKNGSSSTVHLVKKVEKGGQSGET